VTEYKGKKIEDDSNVSVWM
jgi:hypothetical protein